MAVDNHMPALFLGHGNPMITLDDNVYTRAWRSLGERLPRPRAILCVSAHWYLPETLVTGDRQPKTIHDFSGFPDALYEVTYPVPGDPGLAQQVVELLSPEPVATSEDWGVDHGAWSVLRHLFPRADVPVVQLSLNSRRDAQWHFEVARRLQSLREDKVLIVGSGNLVHNLRAYAWNGLTVDPFDWALRFDTAARAWIQAGNYRPLIQYKEQGSDAMMSVPTPDHFLPLLYVLAQSRAAEDVSFPVQGFEGGSMSMLAVQVGEA